MKFYIPRIYADSKFEKYYEDKENDNIKAARAEFREKRSAEREKISQKVRVLRTQTDHFCTVGKPRIWLRHRRSHRSVSSADSGLRRGSSFTSSAA